VQLTCSSVASTVRQGRAVRRSLSEARGGSPATKTFIMKSKRALTQRAYHSPDNSQVLSHSSLLDQSLQLTSTRGLKTSLNQKEIEILHLHTKCLKWKQRCKTQQEEIKRLSRKLASTDEAYRGLKDRYWAQVQAAKAYEERKRGIDHFQVQDSASVAIRLHQAQIVSLQSQIEALEATQTAIIAENSRLKHPTEESETAVRLMLTDLTGVHRDLAELNNVLKVYMNRGACSVADIIGTFFHKVHVSGLEASSWVKLVSLVREICREVQEMRLGLERLTEPDGLTALLTAQY